MSARFIVLVLLEKFPSLHTPWCIQNCHRRSKLLKMTLSISPAKWEKLLSLIYPLLVHSKLPQKKTTFERWEMLYSSLDDALSVLQSGVLHMAMHLLHSAIINQLEILQWLVCILIISRIKYPCLFYHVRIIFKKYHNFLLT